MTLTKGVEIVKNKTELDGIKTVAQYLLNLPIRHYKENCSILDHPFIRIAIYTDKQGQFMKITTKQDEDYAKNCLRNTIDKLEDYISLLVMVSPPYLPLFYKLTNNYLSAKDYAESLKFTWTEVEFPNKDPNVNQREWINYFKRADKNLLMSQEELEVYNNLPNEVEIYRGINSHGDYKGLSWTLDYEKAKWFSTRYDKGKTGKVYKGTIDKKYIFAYFDERNEFEVVVDYTKINDVEEIN